MRGLTEMHRGHMRIESSDGMGTAVTVEFPLTAPARAEETPDLEPALSAGGSF